MKYSHKHTPIARILNRTLLAFLFITLGYGCIINAIQPKKWIKATEGKKGFAGLVTLTEGAHSGNLLLCANPNLVLEFDPESKQFVRTVFTTPNYSFLDDLTLSPGRCSGASFLDGAVPTFDLTTTALIQSNLGPFPVTLVTGVFMQRTDSGTQGIDPIAYRASNNKVYFQAFDPSVLFAVDLLGSGTMAVTLSEPTGLNGMQFGPDDKLYAVSPFAGLVVKINADSGFVTTVTEGLSNPIALKVASDGTIYFVERGTADVYKLNPTTGVKTLIATLDPALDNLCLSLSENKLFITNDENKIYKVNVNNGNTKILFQSPITQPWDVAFDTQGVNEFVYIADSGSVKKVNANNGNLVDIIILDSADNPGLNGFGLACGLDVGPGTSTLARITLADITIGDIASFDKDLSNGVVVREFISGFETGLFTKQNFSTLRITTTTTLTGEYFLALNSIDGQIVKVYRDELGIAQTLTYFDGLSTPVKLKLHNGYVYIVEAGKLNQGIPNTGRVSRIPLTFNPPAPSSQEILLDNLDKPEGLDIYDDKMIVFEVGAGQLLQASASSASTWTVVLSGIPSTPVVLISDLNPVPIDPTSKVAVDTTGKRIYYIDSDNNIVYKYKRHNF